MILAQSLDIGAWIAQVSSLINQGGWLVIFMLTAWAGHRRYWVFGWVLKESEKREEQWRSVALSSLQVSDRLTGQPGAEV